MTKKPEATKIYFTMTCRDRLIAAGVAGETIGLRGLQAIYQRGSLIDDDLRRELESLDDRPPPDGDGEKFFVVDDAGVGVFVLVENDEYPGLEDERSPYSCVTFKRLNLRQRVALMRSLMQAQAA